MQVSHLALLGAIILTSLSTSRAFAVSCGEALLACLREARVGFSVHVHRIRIVKLLALVSWLVLTHVHWLRIAQLAILLVARNLVWVDHRKHLAEALTNAGDSLSWIPERQFVPWHKLDTFAVHVDESLLA